MTAAQPPLLFAAEIVLVLALAAAASAMWLGLSEKSLQDARTRWQRVLRPYVRRQRDLAQGLGLRFRDWVLLRLAAGAAGLITGSLIGIWTVTVAGTLLGLFGVPWLLSGRAARRRLRMERALASLVLSVRNLMSQSNLALDRALREAAQSPAPELTHILAPLAGDLPVSEALADVARRARSPLGDLLVSAMLMARTHNPLAMVKVTDEVLVPLMEQAVEIQEENHATVAQQRAAAIAIGGIMAVLFVAVMRVPSMYAYYATPAGQLVLLAVIGMYLGLVWLLSRVARPLTWVEWDIDAVRREAEALVA